MARSNPDRIGSGAYSDQWACRRISLASFNHRAWVVRYIPKRFCNLPMTDKNHPLSGHQAFTSVYCCVCFHVAAVLARIVIDFCQLMPKRKTSLASSSYTGNDENYQQTVIMMNIKSNEWLKTISITKEQSWSAGTKTSGQSSSISSANSSSGFMQCCRC